MLLLFVGPSTTGKTTAANQIKHIIQATMFSGKDYLRKDKSEQNAWHMFKKDLQEAIAGRTNIIYLLTDTEKFNEILHMGNIVVIKFTAELAILKKRFSKRTNGIVPPPLEKMLMGQLKTWGPIVCNHEIDTSEMTRAPLFSRISCLNRSRNSSTSSLSEIENLVYFLSPSG